MPSRSPHREILFEGFSAEEILELPKESIEQLILLNQPIVFRAGSATILGSFGVSSNHLVLELAEIEGGGEGVLPSLASLANRYARLNGLSAVEWIVHAASCAKPNTKLRRVLELRGFTVKDVGGSDAYYLCDFLSPTLTASRSARHPD